MPRRRVLSNISIRLFMLRKKINQNLSAMAKATIIKEALKRWEDHTKQNSAEAKEINLQFQWAPIEKMDATLSTLVKCEYDSIAKITSFFSSKMYCSKKLCLFHF